MILRTFRQAFALARWDCDCVTDTIDWLWTAAPGGEPDLSEAAGAVAAAKRLGMPLQPRYSVGTSQDDFADRTQLSFFSMLQKKR